MQYTIASGAGFAACLTELYTVYIAQWFAYGFAVETNFCVWLRVYVLMRRSCAEDNYYGAYCKRKPGQMGYQIVTPEVTRLLDSKQWKLLWHQQWAIVGYAHSAHGYARGLVRKRTYLRTRVTTMCVYNNGIIVDVIIASQMAHPQIIVCLHAERHYDKILKGWNLARAEPATVNAQNWGTEYPN